MTLDNSTQTWWFWNILGSYEQLCPNLSPEVPGDNDEAEVKSTSSNSGTSGK